MPQDENTRFQNFLIKNILDLKRDTTEIDEVLTQLVAEGIILPDTKTRISKKETDSDKLYELFIGNLKAKLGDLQTIIKIFEDTSNTAVANKLKEFLTGATQEPAKTSSKTESDAIKKVKKSENTSADSSMDIPIKDHKRDLRDILTKSDYLDDDVQLKDLFEVAIIEEHKVHRLELCRELRGNGKGKRSAIDSFLTKSISLYSKNATFGWLIEHLKKIGDTDDAEQVRAYADNLSPSSPDNENKTSDEQKTETDSNRFDSRRTTAVVYKAIDYSDGHSLDFINEMEPLKVEVRKPSGLSFCTNKKNAYTIDSSPKGYALLINNREFDDPSSNRPGAEFDTKYCYNLFTKLNYEVFCHENLREKDMIKAIEEFRKKFEEKPVDSCVVIIMSHGECNTVLTKDGRNLNLWEDIVYQFDNIGCPALIGKPKIFIVQACQTFQIGRTEDDSLPVPNKIPRISDMLVCMSTTPGFKANRDTFLGTWYIYTLTKVFMENAHNMEIREIMKKVQRSMAGIQSHDNLAQVSPWYELLFKDFYFF